MREVFGFDMNVKNDALPTSPYAVLDLGEGNVLLMNDVSLTYSSPIQRLSPVGEVATYFVRGLPTGQLVVGTTVGTKGFFAPYLSTADMCGTLKSVNISIENRMCKVEENTEDALNNLQIQGIALTALSLQISAGTMQLQQTASYEIGAIKPTN